MAIVMREIVISVVVVFFFVFPSVRIGRERFSFFLFLLAP